MDKKEYIQRLAKFLIDTGTTMHVRELAHLLNWNGFRTNYDTEFQGSRGTYTLISATYQWLMDRGQEAEAEQVARASERPR